MVMSKCIRPFSLCSNHIFVSGNVTFVKTLMFSQILDSKSEPANFANLSDLLSICFIKTYFSQVIFYLSAIYTSNQQHAICQSDYNTVIIPVIHVSVCIIVHTFLTYIFTALFYYQTSLSWVVAHIKNR